MTPMTRALYHFGQSPGQAERDLGAINSKISGAGAGLYPDPPLPPANHYGAAAGAGAAGHPNYAGGANRRRGVLGGGVGGTGVLGPGGGGGGGRGPMASPADVPARKRPRAVVSSSRESQRGGGGGGKSPKRQKKRKGGK